MSGIGVHDGIVLDIAQRPKNDLSSSLDRRSHEILRAQSRARELRIYLICFSNLARFSNLASPTLEIGAQQRGSKYSRNII